MYDMDARGADFTEADLSGSMLGQHGRSPSNSRPGVRLEAAVFTVATLRETDLSGVDLSKVRGLTRGQVGAAISDEGTRFPPGISASQAARGA